MEQEKINELAEEMEEYYLDMSDEDSEKLDTKTFNNKAKCLEMLLKAKTEAVKAETEAKKLDFEIDSAKADREINSRKVDVEQNKLDTNKEIELKKLELEQQRFIFEQNIETEKLKVEQQKNIIESVKAENERKASKKDFILGIAKTVVGIGGTVASVAFGAWSLVTTMKFEETGTVRTSAGKFAQGIAKGAMAKLENVKKDI